MKTSRRWPAGSTIQLGDDVKAKYFRSVCCDRELGVYASGAVLPRCEAAECLIRSVAEAGWTLERIARCWPENSRWALVPDRRHDPSQLVEVVADRNAALVGSEFLR